MERESQGIMELEGTPDQVLEVVSKTSVRKDTVLLRDLYFKAGIPEYWLVDARKSPARFDIYRHTADGYVATRRRDGWLKSAVFGKQFRFVESKDRFGDPAYSYGQLKALRGQVVRLSLHWGPPFAVAARRPRNAENPQDPAYHRLADTRPHNRQR